MSFQKKLIYPSEKIKKNKPTNLEPIDEHLFQSKYKDILFKTIPFREKKCYILPSGHLFKNFFLNKKYVNLWIGYSHFFKLYLDSIISITKIRKKVKIKKALFVTNTNSTNFFHWYLDVLQKLEFINQVNDLKLKIVIPYNHIDKYKILSLATFDLDFYFQKKNEIIFVDELILFPDIANMTGNYRKRLVLKLRNRLRKYWLKTLDLDSDKKKRIYITRKNASRRRIINENKIIPLLKKLNFHILDFDLLNYEDQLKYILNCDILASMHGAGLTHMLWMKKKSKILEIRARDSKENCYYCLASDLSHQYFYSFADKSNLEKTNTVSDFIIDKKHFFSQIYKLL